MIFFGILLRGKGLETVEMSSFFTLPASQRKRKGGEDHAAAPASKRRGVAKDNNQNKRARSRNKERDDSISGSDTDEYNESLGSSIDNGSDEESDDEPAAERRLRLAERYLENLKDEVDDVGFDAAEIDRDLIAERLREDVVC